MTFSEQKTNKNYLQIFYHGLMGGFMIGIGGYTSQMATAYGHPKLISAMIFPIGLIMIVLSGMELFTGNCLLFKPLIKAPSKKPILKVLATSYLGNLLGSIILGFGLRVFCPDPNYEKVAEAMALAKVSLPYPETLVKAVLCNMLVCIAVWLAYWSQGTTEKAIAAFVPVFAFVFLGFEHSVANMFFFAIGGAPLIPAITSLIIVTIGNFVGGALISLIFEVK